MAEVSVVYQLMPTGVDVDLEKLKEEVRKVLAKTRIHSMQERPIAFGIKAIEVTVLLEDRGGVSVEVENALSKVEGVESVRITSVDRLL